MNNHVSICNYVSNRQSSDISFTIPQLRYHAIHSSPARPSSIPIFYPIFASTSSAHFFHPLLLPTFSFCLFHLPLITPPPPHTHTLFPILLHCFTPTSSTYTYPLSSYLFLHETLYCSSK